MHKGPIEKEKVIRCPWRSVQFYAKRRAPKGYVFRLAWNLERNKTCEKGDKATVRACITYVRNDMPDHIVRSHFG